MPTSAGATVELVGSTKTRRNPELAQRLFGLVQRVVDEDRFDSVPAVRPSLARKPRIWTTPADPRLPRPPALQLVQKVHQLWLATVQLTHELHLIRLRYPVSYSSSAPPVVRASATVMICPIKAKFVVSFDLTADVLARWPASTAAIAVGVDVQYSRADVKAECVPSSLAPLLFDDPRLTATIYPLCSAAHPAPRSSSRSSSAGFRTPTSAPGRSSTAASTPSVGTAELGALPPSRNHLPDPPIFPPFVLPFLVRPPLRFRPSLLSPWLASDLYARASVRGVSGCCCTLAEREPRRACESSAEGMVSRSSEGYICGGPRLAALARTLALRAHASARPSTHPPPLGADTANPRRAATERSTGGEGRRCWPSCGEPVRVELVEGTKRWRVGRRGRRPEPTRDWRVPGQALVAGWGCSAEVDVVERDGDACAGVTRIRKRDGGSALTTARTRSGGRQPTHRWWPLY